MLSHSVAILTLEAFSAKLKLKVNKPHFVNVAVKMINYLLLKIIEISHLIQ